MTYVYQHKQKPFSAGIEEKSIEVKMLVHHPLQEYVEHKLLYTSTAGIEVEAASKGEMFIDEVKSGSVVLRLRPITDQAVQALLNAKENNKLLNMIVGILKQIHIPEMFNDPGTLEIKVQVCYACQELSNQGMIRYSFSRFIILFKYQTFYLYISLYMV